MVDYFVVFLIITSVFLILYASYLKKEIKDLSERVHNTQERIQNYEQRRRGLQYEVEALQRDRYETRNTAEMRLRQREQEILMAEQRMLELSIPRSIIVPDSNLRDGNVRITSGPVGIGYTDYRDNDLWESYLQNQRNRRTSPSIVPENTIIGSMKKEKEDSPEKEPEPKRSRYETLEMD